MRKRELGFESFEGQFANLETFLNLKDLRGTTLVISCIMPIIQDR